MGADHARPALMRATLAVVLLMPLAAVILLMNVTYASDAARPADQLLGTPSYYSESVVSYWQETLPGATMPAILRDRLTPLKRSTSAAGCSKGSSLMIMAESELPAKAAAFCKDANLFCDWKSLSAVVQPSVCRPSFCRVYRSFQSATLAASTNDDTPRRSLLLPPGTNEHGGFFRERELFQGAQMKLNYQHDDTPRRSFLPRDLAEIFPFGLQKLPELLQKFGIPSSSLLASGAESTLKACEETPMRGETVSCATSIEAMADFVVSDLQTNKVEVLTFSGGPTSQQYAKDQNFVVQEVGLKADVHQKYISCHEAIFLYDVYHCHDISNSKVYSASLRAASDGIVTHAVALCHMDTSQWNPLHVAFYDLGNKPGESEACHWIGDNDVVFVAAASH